MPVYPGALPATVLREVSGGHSGGLSCRERRAHDSETCASLLITIGGAPCRKQIWRIDAP